MYWTPESGFVRSRYAPIQEPVGERHGTAVMRDAAGIFLPATAVDFSGNRIGQGGGYYDKFLAALAAMSSAPGRGVRRQPTLPRCRLPPSSMTPRCCPPAAFPPSRSTGRSTRRADPGRDRPARPIRPPDPGSGRGDRIGTQALRLLRTEPVDRHIGGDPDSAARDLLVCPRGGFPVPTYAYACKDCSHAFEIVQSFTRQLPDVLPRVPGHAAQEVQQRRRSVQGLRLLPDRFARRQGQHGFPGSCSSRGQPRARRRRQLGTCRLAPAASSAASGLLPGRVRRCRCAVVHIGRSAAAAALRGSVAWRHGTFPHAVPRLVRRLPRLPCRLPRLVPFRAAMPAAGSGRWSGRDPPRQPSCRHVSAAGLPFRSRIGPAEPGRRPPRGRPSWRRLRGWLNRNRRLAVALLLCIAAGLTVQQLTPAPADTVAAFAAAGDLPAGKTLAPGDVSRHQRAARPRAWRQLRQRGRVRGKTAGRTAAPGPAPHRRPAPGTGPARRKPARLGGRAAEDGGSGLHPAGLPRAARQRGADWRQRL